MLSVENSRLCSHSRLNGERHHKRKNPIRFDPLRSAQLLGCLVLIGRADGSKDGATKSPKILALFRIQHNGFFDS